MACRKDIERPWKSQTSRGGLKKAFGKKLTLAELRSATGGLQAVLHISMCSNPLIYRAFLMVSLQVAPLFNSNIGGISACFTHRPNAEFTTLESSSGLLYLT